MKQYIIYAPDPLTGTIRNGDTKNYGNYDLDDKCKMFVLSVAMKAMNKVASHINEMQKLHEEYGAVFDQLINEQTADKKEVNMIATILFRVINYQPSEISVT